jgi:hypothetical protein
VVDRRLDSSAFDPNLGARYWWADFARTQHPVLTVGPKRELTGAKYFELGEFYRSTVGGLKTSPTENTTLYGARRPRAALPFILGAPCYTSSVSLHTECDTGRLDGSTRMCLYG